MPTGVPESWVVNANLRLDRGPSSELQATGSDPKTANLAVSLPASLIPLF